MQKIIIKLYGIKHTLCYPSSDNLIDQTVVSCFCLSMQIFNLGQEIEIMWVGLVEQLAS